MQGGEAWRCPWRGIASLKPYDNNAKLHTREQIEAVEASIREFGFRNPVIAWHNEQGDAEIVAGHARTAAARNLGMDEVPCIFVDDLNNAQRRALTLADNKTTMMTGFDEEMSSAYELDVLARSSTWPSSGSPTRLGSCPTCRAQMTTGFPMSSSAGPARARYGTWGRAG